MYLQRIQNQRTVGLGYLKKIRIKQPLVLVIYKLNESLGFMKELTDSFLGGYLNFFSQFFKNHGYIYIIIEYLIF